jgi:glycosyltransferase involved in cell wall biosynthesis
MVRKAGIRIVTRSINFEPSHFIEEDGVSIINILKYIPKYISELIVAKLSDVVISINPNEERIYKKIGAKVVLNLPLRSLPLYLNTEMNHTRSSPINVFFMGSTYTVTHNKEALRMVIADIAPKIYQIDPLGFKFHIMGNKFPEEFKVYIKDNVANVGYQEDIDSFLKNMDIAIIPSLFGAGMQQKIFESLARGFPTITSQRGMGGYTFTDGVDVLFA